MQLRTKVLSRTVQPAASLGVKNATASVEKLDGTNYLPWKRQVNITLKLQCPDKVQTLVQGEDVEELIDMQAVLFLLSCMNDDHKLQVQAEILCLISTVIMQIVVELRSIVC